MGCLIAGFLFLFIYELENRQASLEIWEKEDSKKNLKKIIKYVSIIVLLTFYVVMGVIIWKYLPSKEIGRDGM